MEPMQFRLGEWLGEAIVQVKAPVGGVSTYRAQGAGDEEMGLVLDYFMAAGLSKLKWWRTMAPDRTSR